MLMLNDRKGRDMASTEHGSVQVFLMIGLSCWVAGLEMPIISIEVETKASLWAEVGSHNYLNRNWVRSWHKA